MKKLLFFVLFIICCASKIMAQDVMVIEKTDNTTERYNVDDIKRVYFATQGATILFCTETGEDSSTGVTGLTSDGVTINVKILGISYYYCSYDIYIGTDKFVSPTNYLFKKTGKLSSNCIISESFTGLSSNTTYFFVIYIHYRTSGHIIFSKDYVSDVGSFTTTNVSVPTFTIETQNTTNIAGTSARVQAHFKIQNATSKYTIGFFVSKNSIPTKSNSANYYYEHELSSANYEDTHSVEIIDLTPGTTYYVRPYILYDGTYHYGTTTSFTTKAYAPTFSVTTQGITDIKETTAKAEGSIYTNNAAKEYEVGFFVSTNSNLTNANSTKYRVKNLSENYEKTPYTYTAIIDNLKQGTKYYVRAYLLYDGTYEYGNVLSFTTRSSTPDPEPIGKLAGHEWVDLGLPSGTKWATCNVGASQPQDYGDYYAFGETSVKKSYSMDNYKYYGYEIGNISGTSYDAARAKWGSSWRMATKAEWTELIENCTSKTETKNGVKGTRFTGKNGYSIFLPWAGCKLGETLYEDKFFRTNTMQGHYYTGTETGEHLATGCLLFNNSFEDIVKWMGLSIRAVWK